MSAIAPVDITVNQICRNIRVGDIGNISNQKEQNCVETTVPHREFDDARPWPDSLPLRDAAIVGSSDQAGLDDRFAALCLIRDYMTVKEEHADWLMKMYKVAKALSQAESGESLDLERFSWGLIYLSHLIIQTRDTLSTLTPEIVYLGRQSDSAPEESISMDMRIILDVGKAMDQCAGMTSKGREVAVALDLALNSDSVREWLVRCSNMAERANIKEEIGKAMIEPQMPRPSDTTLMHTVAKHGREFLQKWEDLSIPPQPHAESRIADGIMGKTGYFQYVDHVCVAYIKSLRILEVYEIQPLAKDCGMLRLIEVIHNVKKPGAWLGTVQQDFRMGEDGCLTACVEGEMCKGAWDMEKGKKHWTRRTYVPRKLVATEDERVVQEAMKERGFSGGCWNLILRGKSPCQNASEKGYRMLEACTVVAGLALHFNSIMSQHNAAKGAYWQKMETIKLANSRVLSLGCCAISATVDRRRDHAEKVTVIAGKDSHLWQNFWHMG